MSKTILGLCTFIELTSVAVLTGIALKRNNDAYKAAVKCIDLELALAFSDLENTVKDIEIDRLKKELEKLKK